MGLRPALGTANGIAKTDNITEIHFAPRAPLFMKTINKVQYGVLLTQNTFGQLFDTIGY